MRLMKSLIIILSILLPNLAAAGGNRYALEVDGLACPFCAYGIEKKLSEIPGVAEIEVDVEAGRVVVTMSGGAKLEETTAREQVKRAGFALRSMKPLAGGE